MKSDLASAIISAILGFAIAFFATNFFIPAIEDVSFSNLETKVTSELAEPDQEVFNYKALNPTVEVYVGQCQKFNSNGECIDDVVNVQPEEQQEESTDANNSDNANTTDDANSADNAVTPENTAPTEPTDEPNTNTESN